LTTGEGGNPVGAAQQAHAVLRTVLYADIFQYPLTIEEISHWAIGAALTPQDVTQCLSSSPWLAERVEHVNGYVAPRGRAQAIVPLREARRRVAARLWPAARRYAWILGRLPFVRRVAITGALALDNADLSGDIDLMIVTAPHRVWLVRAMSIALVRLARLEGVQLCPNYVVAETVLAQQRRDLFIAHEVVQVVPLVGRALYDELRVANAWCADYLPNAVRPRRDERDLAPGRLGRAWRGALEWLLGGKPGEQLEAWERERKLRKFAAQARRAPVSSILDAEQVKGHFDDYGEPVLRAYRERLREFGLEE
jgi:hypothetical protein